MVKKMTATLHLENGDLILKTPYNRTLVDDLKASVPLYARRWEPKRKVWVIAYIHGQDVVDVVKRNLRENLAIPKQSTYANSPVATQTQVLRIEYIGAAKEREDGSLSAMAYCNGDWSVVLPLSVLREWFEGDNSEAVKPDVAPNFYVVLGVKRNATDDDIKRAYRIAAKTWHPDVNQDDTTKQFQIIQRAYEVLNTQRKKYDAGLRLQQDSEKKQSRKERYAAQHNLWLPPKRAGLLTVECKETVGRLMVSRILFWDEILDSQGRILVSYWETDKDKFTMEYV